MEKTKSSSTLETLGIYIDLYSKCIESQFTPEMYWLNIEINHVKPICIVDISNDEELRECFNWKNSQTLLIKIHKRKGRKIVFLD